MFEKIRSAMDGTYERRARRNACTGLTIGFLAGALAGILFAPKSGKETRADICEGTKIGLEKVKEVAEHSVDKAKEKFESVKEHLREGKEEVVEELVEALEEEE